MALEERESPPNEYLLGKISVHYVKGVARISVTSWCNAITNNWFIREDSERYSLDANQIGASGSPWKYNSVGVVFSFLLK